MTGTLLNEASTGVLFHLDATGVTPVPTDIDVVDLVTLSNGDTDVRRIRFAVTS